LILFWIAISLNQKNAVEHQVPATSSQEVPMQKPSVSAVPPASESLPKMSPETQKPFIETEKPFTDLEKPSVSPVPPASEQLPEISPEPQKPFIETESKANAQAESDNKLEPLPPPVEIEEHQEPAAAEKGPINITPEAFD
jgi:hypothetical protein